MLARIAAFEFGYCEWNGRLAAVTNASGFVVQYAHNIMDRVTNISWRTTSGATLGGFAYEYDALGHIVSRSHALGTNAFDRVYTYDDFDRLASDGDVAYTYDAAGNRMTRTEDGDTITYTLGVGDRLASWTGGAYTHDAAGNVTRIERDDSPTLDLAWNSQYQLVSVSTNGVFVESYTYDALGRRVTTTTLEGTTRHVYDDNWQVVADIDEQGNVVASYTWGEGIDKLLAVTIGGATYYALTDIQGTVWGYVDSQNNVVASWTYDAWGNVLSEDISPSTVALASIRYRFQGREWSAATGLINFRMRWYDAETGRWLSKDPIGLSGGLNLYAFCGDNPANCIDPSGRSYLLLLPFLGGVLGGGALGYVTSGNSLLGAIAGALGGGFGVLAVVVGGPAIGGVVSGAVSSTIMEVGEGECGSVCNVVVGAMLGGLFGAAGGHISDVVGGKGGAILGGVFFGMIPGFVNFVINLPKQVYRAIFTD